MKFLNNTSNLFLYTYSVILGTDLVSSMSCLSTRRETDLINYNFKEKILRSPSPGPKLVSTKILLRTYLTLFLTPKRRLNF